MSIPEPSPPSEIELTDEDILDAMRHIPGYLDISTADFRAIYHLAHTRAMDRLLRQVRAADLMLAEIQPLQPDTPLDQAARQLVDQGRKGLPVVDDQDRVVGILTETDFLRRLGADSFLALLLQLVEDQSLFTHRCHQTRVRTAMTAPAVCVEEQSGFSGIVQAFSQHSGRSMPVVDADGRLRGLLLRKDFVKSHYLDALP